MPGDVANRLTRKLGLIQTPGSEAMRAFAMRVRELQKQGRTLDQAAIMAATDKFPAEFKATGYANSGEPIEPLITEIEKL